MHRLKNRGIVVLAVLGLFALSGIAMADTEDDTIVNHHINYDEGFLALNITSLEYSPNFQELFAALSDECTLMAPDDAEPEDYSISFNGETVTVNQGGTPIELGNCNDFIGGYFYGPNGQINKGMIMKFLNSIYAGPGRGCVIREFAQLDFDHENQVQSAQDFEAPSASDEDPLVIEDAEFMTFKTNCLHGKNGGNGGPPEHVLQKHAEKWDGNGPGKSASAPGHTKDD